MTREGNAKRKEDVLDEIAAENGKAAGVSVAALLALIACILNDAE